MKSEKKLKILWVLFIISILITISCISSTYAKYYDAMNANYQFGSIKRWNLKVNEKDIYDQTRLEDVITPILLEDENTRKELVGVGEILVPGREGYFEIEIDFTEVDVPFITEFEVTQKNSPMLTDFELYGYTIRKKGDELESEIKSITINKDKDTVAPMKLTEEFNPIDKTDEEKVQIIRAYFRWNDADTATMNNAQDTDYRGKVIDEDTNTLLEYTASLTFSQKL